MGMKITRGRLRRIRGGSENQFPGKLYDLLEYVATNGLESAISWIRNGTAMMIHDPEKLVEILPNIFGQIKYRSFRRQLNMWHFHRILEGPHCGAFAHPCFIRGNKELINYMNRHASLAESLSLIATDKSRRPARSKEERLSHSSSRTLPFLSPSNFLPTKSEHESCVVIPNSSLVHQLPTLESDPSLRVSEIPSIPDEEEDWSLLSDCVDVLLHGEVLPNSSKQASWGSDMAKFWYIPVEALAPGMEEPASPQIVEHLFAELGSL